MYRITIEFDWQSEDADYHFLEVWGIRCGNVQRRQNPTGKFSAYCGLTTKLMDGTFDSFEEGKEWLIDELREYFEGKDIEFTEGANFDYFRNIKCDMCGKHADFLGTGGQCIDCGKNLCAQCAGNWTEVMDDDGDETSHCVCKRCRDKFAKNAEFIEDDSPCDRCGKHANVGNGGGICEECEDILCGTCGWWSDEDTSPLCIRCRDKRTGDDLIAKTTGKDYIKAEPAAGNGHEKLNQCNDCGSEDLKIGHIYTTSDSDRRYYVHCNYCCTETATVHGTKEQATVAWNKQETRSNEQRQQRSKKC